MSSKLIRATLAFALALSASPSVSANEEFGKIYLRGSKSMKSGDLNGAINALSEAIGVNGQNGLAYLRRGECYSNLQFSHTRRILNGRVARTND